MPDTDKWILESASSIRYIDPFAGSPPGSRSDAAEFVEEVEDEDDLVARRVGRSVRVGHRYGEAFAIRVKIEGSKSSWIPEPSSCAFSRSRAALLILSGVHGGSQTTSTSALVTPGSFATASFTC